MLKCKSILTLQNRFAVLDQICNKIVFNFLAFLEKINDKNNFCIYFITSQFLMQWKEPDTRRKIRNIKTF